jgi:hypothetical protein
MKLSRKTLLAVIAALAAILTALQQTFGLMINPAAVMGGLTVFLLYVFWEGKADFKRMAGQAGKWKDPKFWLALVNGVVVALNESLGLALPTEIISAVVAFIIGILFKVRPT